MLFFEEEDVWEEGTVSVELGAEVLVIEGVSELDAAI